MRKQSRVSDTDLSRFLGRRINKVGMGVNSYIYVNKVSIDYYRETYVH